jgi:hypothetical protein
VRGVHHFFFTHPFEIGSDGHFGALVPIPVFGFGWRFDAALLYIGVIYFPIRLKMRFGI